MTEKRNAAQTLGWFGILRLGLVQTALGAIVVLTTSTMNRVMVVELALPAMLPGALVAFHYAIQILRPRWGFAADKGGRATPWIIGGIGVLGTGGVLAAVATAWMATSVWSGVALAVLGFLLIGIGVGAAGTSLLVLLAKRVAPERRAAAATIVWVMMIAGFIVTAATAGHFLDPFSGARLVVVTASVAVLAFVVTLVAVWGVEGRGAPVIEEAQGVTSTQAVPFMEALREVWAEAEARRFTIFVFVSMLAYSAQDLILEPYAGEIFAYSPGESTKLAGVQHGGVLMGMILIALATTVFKGTALASLRLWTIAGCLASAVALFALAIAGFTGPAWPLRTSVFLLGLANGAFAIAAIARMMALASEGRQSREGVRMGLWGAAQAIAFGAGGFLGALAVDVAKLVTGGTAQAYISVFAVEGCLFLVAAALAAGIRNASVRREPETGAVGAFGNNILAGAKEG